MVRCLYGVISVFKIYNYNDKMTSNEEVVSKLLNYRNQAAIQSVHLWKSKGEEEAYAEEQKTLKILQNVLRKRISEVERETKGLEPLVKVTENTLESLKQALEMNSMSVIIHNEHEKCVMDQVKKIKKTTNDILDAYCKHIDECKEELENNNPNCKILHDLSIQKRKVKLDCLVLEEKVKQIQYRNRVLKDVSYKQIVDFSKTWLDRRLFEKKKNILNKLKLEKKNWLRKLMEVTETSKFNQKMRYIKDTMYTTKAPQIKFSQPTDTKPPVDKKPDTEKNKPEKKAPANDTKNPFNELELLLENSEQFKQTKTSNVAQNFLNNTAVTRTIIKPDNSKVLILDNQLLTSKMKRTLTKEERSKEYDARLQKVFTNLKRKIFHQPSAEVPRTQPSNANGDVKQPQQEMKVVKDMPPSQELLMYSQDESEMRFASQQSEAGAERNVLGPANKANQRAHLDINQNHSVTAKMNKRVTFSDKDKVSEGFFVGNKQMDGGMMMKKDSYPFAMMNMSSDVGNGLKASEKEYNQFSMSFAGAASGPSFSNFAGLDEGLFKIPNTPTGNVQSQKLNMEDGPDNLNLEASYNPGDMSGFADTGEFDSSVMLSPIGNFEEITGTSINQGVAFNFGTMQF